MALQDNQENTSSFDYHKLFYAVKSGSYEKVKQLLETNCLKIDNEWIDYKLVIFAVKCHRQISIAELLINFGCRVKGPKTNQYKTPLYYAVEGNKTSVVKLLLKVGASISDKDVNSETPLYLALKENYFDEMDLMLSMYDFENIDCNIVDENIHFNIACMRNCVNLVKRFIEKGIDVNAVQNWHLKKWSGFTPLHFAVKNQAVDVVKILLEHKADFTKQNMITLQSPLHLAFDSEVTDTMNEIIDSILNYHSLVTLNPVDSKRVSHFHISCTRDNSTLVEAFLKSDVDVNHPITLPNCPVGLSPLHLAVDFKKEKNVRILLLHGATVNFADDTKSTALHTAVEDNNKEVIKMLLEYGADSNLKNCRNMSPWNLVAKNKLYGLVKLFLQHGADVNSFDDTLSTALHRTVQDNNQEISQILLEYGADVNLKNRDNVSSWNLVVREKLFVIVELLLHHEADVNSFDNTKAAAIHRGVEYNNIEFIKMILNYSADVNLKNGSNFTPLSIAVKNRFYEIAKLLLQFQADPCIQDDEAISAIHIAYLDLPSSQEILDLMLSVDELKNISNKDNLSVLHIACIKNDIGLVKKLLQSNNININACINWKAKKWAGFTALHFAAYFYSYDLIELLLQLKANVNLREKNGYTPLWLAIKYRFDNEIAKKLNEKFLKNKSSFKDSGLEEDEVMDFLFEEMKQLEIVHALVTHNSNLNSMDKDGRPLLFEACFPEVIWDISDDVVNKNFIKTICSRFCDKNMKLNLKILIKHGINLNCTDKSGVSILSHVANGYKSSNAYLHIDKKFFEHCQDTIMDLLTAEDAQK